MTTETLTREFQKRRLILQLGSFGEPERWEWEGVRHLRNPDGTDAESARLITLPATAEEVSAHIDENLVRLREYVRTLEAEVNRLRNSGAA